MNLINKTVRHRILGEGTITDIQDRVVFIRFGEELKKFAFPDAFSKHLNLEDKKCKTYVDNLLAEYNKEAELLRKKEQQEIEKRRLHAKLPLNDNSQAAFGFIYNDRQKVLQDWTVTTGTYLSGSNFGKPRVASDIYPNTACILTCLDKGEPEENRYIWGLFMVQDDFVGSECTDGIIPAHPDYRLELSDERKDRFLFWRYFEPPVAGKKPSWGSKEFRYVSNWKTAHLLLDIYSVAQEPEKQLSRDFFEYFCRLNKFNSEVLISHLQKKKNISGGYYVYP
ncbi:MAG TPA: hypothetical protein GX011_01975 [Clostridiales bacterium]|jgi:hypothetical protein|nr:hypothetical protein [Clostridiales bacterium]